MSTVVTFVSPKYKDDKRHVKIGWSWQVAFFSWFLGVPLFQRRLPAAGLVMICLTIMTFYISPGNDYYLHPHFHQTIGNLIDRITPAQWLLALMQLAGGLILAPTANARYAASLWADGYELSETENNPESIRHARAVWNLADRPAQIAGNSPATVPQTSTGPVGGV